MHIKNSELDPRGLPIWIKEMEASRSIVNSDFAGSKSWRRPRVEEVGDIISGSGSSSNPFLSQIINALLSFSHTQQSAFLDSLEINPDPSVLSWLEVS
jgi:hypothetical protein